MYRISKWPALTVHSAKMACRTGAASKRRILPKMYPECSKSALKLATETSEDVGIRKELRHLGPTDAEEVNRVQLVWAGLDPISASQPLSQPGTMVVCTKFLRVS